MAGREKKKKAWVVGHRNPDTDSHSKGDCMGIPKNQSGRRAL